jgi:hypothetical protein
MLRNIGSAPIDGWFTADREGKDRAKTSGTEKKTDFRKPS